MFGVFLLVATLGLAVVGFAMIAVSQKQHWWLLRLSRSATPVMALRLAGSLFLAVSTIPAVLRDGLGFGLLIWAIALSIAAVLVVIWMAKRRSDDGPQPQKPSTYPNVRPAQDQS